MSTDNFEDYSSATWNSVNSDMDPPSRFVWASVKHLPNPTEFVMWIIKTKLPDGRQYPKSTVYIAGNGVSTYRPTADGVGDYLDDLCSDAIDEYRLKVDVFDEYHPYRPHRHHFINNVVRKLYNEFEVIHKDNPGVPGDF